MLKTIKKIVTILLITILMYANFNMAIWGTISYAINNNNFPYQEGSTANIKLLLSNPKLYCINHGKVFSAGNYYCYDVNEASAVMAYLVSKQPEGQRTENHDPIANAIWYLTGSTTEPGVNYQTILNEAIEQTSIKESGNISITGPDDLTMSEVTGIYGPFVIKYPTDGNGNLIGNNLVVTVNGIRLVNIPQSGAEFYLTEAEGIKRGQENIIEVSYQGTIYSGTYAKLTPERVLTKNATCNKCNAKFTYNSYGYTADGYAYNSDVWVLSETSKHNNANCNGQLVEEGTIYYYDTLQDLIYIEPQTRPVIETVSKTFSLQQKTISLSGKVWLDGQTGIKPVQEPNGRKDANEAGISGVIVNLFRSNGTIEQTVTTDGNGNYTFTNVPEGQSYYIVFSYDGINYIATRTGVDSDAIESNREGFNNKFKTITKNTAIGTNGIITPLKYNYTGDKAILETMVGGVVKNEFAMNAITTRQYSQDTSNIDFGLVKKEVDLSAFTDVYSAKIRINGRETTYSYNDIKQLKQDANGNLILDTLDKKNVQYNLYLYDSDYNYRIKDYKLDAVHKDYLSVVQNNAFDNLYNQRKQDGDLSVEVTYQILLNNQSTTNATINQIAYYYDANYELQLEGLNPTTTYINEKKYNKVILDVNAAFTEEFNKGIAELTFKVKKDNAGNIYTGAIQNWVEIVSYSTNDGCIDKDSAPDNIKEHSNEDDSDDAAGLNIQLNHIEREISGYVFEDSKTNNPGQYNTGDGLYDGGAKINDVIVQLIEVKNVTVGDTTLRLEYIWQETETGSDIVRYVTNDGTAEGTYNVRPEQGKYTFNKNIIPGNYIVRFIYGDGTYYDSTSAANLTKYNGQDYKSTTDVYYNKTWLESSYSTNASMARDNEARRLEVIDYASKVTADNIEALKIDTQEELNSTWMCSETSLVSIDISTDKTQGDTTNTIVRGVNLGLVKRPQVYLALEKHITGLKIDSITEATATFANYDSALGNGLSVRLDNNNGENIFATATNKQQNTRGEWLIQTEIDKIGGKRLDISYSYRIINIGDLDYIGPELSAKLAAGKTYLEIAQELKTLSSNPNYVPGNYLGTAYYTGKKDNDVAASIRFQIEDYMSTTDGLQLDTTSDFKKISDSTQKNIWDYVSTDSNNKSATNTGIENVMVLQSKNILELISNQQVFHDNPLVLRVYDENIDSTSSAKDIIYRSYVAQLIYPTTGTVTSQSGTLCGGGVTLGNLQTVQSYVEESSVPLLEVAPEADEFMAETVVITMDTGEDKITPIILIISILAGLSIIAIGIVLIKKFVIKHN